MRRLAAGITLAFALAALASAQRPSADWRTLETSHFRIHFPAPFEPWARHLASSIEGIYGDVTALVGYASPRPIDVVVADPAADANGMAIPYLDRPEVVLWTSPPAAETGLGDYTDWTALLATHELAHIVHLTRPRNRSSAILSRLSPVPFGPVALGSPRWVIEGYATLVEGALTGSGRPGGSFRAMVLRRFGLEGKLPEYGELSGSGGWLSGSMAYLVGSAYLEWLSAREGPESLPNLWKRMASSRGGGFRASFRAVFGKSPRDLYDRFRAEITARAVAEEKRLQAEGLIEGEPWQRLRGGTSAPQVSPDGTRLLARRDPSPSESFLAVWDLAETEDERRAEALRRERERRLASDPNEFVERDRPDEPPPRAPRRTLPRVDGFSAADPRWMPGGGHVLFSRRAPDAEGVLHWDLSLWEPESGRVRCVTRGGDVADADPAPGGRFAVGVRERFGRSTLVRVDLERGAVTALETDEPENAWSVWSHPRVSPDARRVAVLVHRGGRWRLVELPVEGGAAAEVALPGSPVAAPAWGPDGRRLFVTVEASGIWNLFELDAETSRVQQRTRVTGGAFSPAPTPDGRGVFFLEMTAAGVNLRRLDLASPPAPGSAASAPEAYPLLPPASPLLRPSPVAARVGETRGYRPGESLAIRPFLNFAVGPDGNAVQLGVDGDDVLGRLHFLAAGSMGDAAGPRGGTVAAAYRGLPVDLTLQVFSAIEKPGRQSLVPRPEFDQERRGSYFGVVWRRELPSGRIRLEAGGGITRVEAFADEDTFDRALGSVAGELAWRRTRGHWGFGLTADAVGSIGATDGQEWTQAAAGLRLAAILPGATLAGSARIGDTWGTPSRFDLWAVGGGPSAILPPGLDRNRVESPALPADVQSGRRLHAFRAELAASGVPLVLYGEWLRASEPTSVALDPVRVAGAELRLERLVPAEFGRNLTFRLGLARILSETPRIRSTRAYAALVYRP